MSSDRLLSARTAVLYWLMAATFIDGNRLLASFKYHVNRGLSEGEALFDDSPPALPQRERHDLQLHAGVTPVAGVEVLPQAPFDRGLSM